MSDIEHDEGMTYAAAGVDTKRGAQAVEAIRQDVRSTYRAEVVGDIGGFGGLFSAAQIAKMSDPVLVSGTDGVGTKLALAQKMGIHDTVGIDLLAMCANDILACGAEPLFFLDYMAIGQLDPDVAREIVAGVAEGCRQSGCALIGGEMAEHPGVMAPEDYDLAGFCVGVVEREKMIDGSKVAQGDVILGLASSGFHSNGFSLVRNVLTEGLTREQLLMPEDDLDGASLGMSLLTPTRLYVKSVLAALAAGCDLHALAHITGGGITENLDRVLPENCDASVTMGTWDVPRVIDLAVAAAGLSEEEALRTFNMGIGMAIVCDPADADAIELQFAGTGETVYRIGEIISGEGTVVYK